MEVIDDYFDSDPEDDKNPFDTPLYAQSLSGTISTAALHQQTLSQQYFRSRRVRKGEVDKPWLKVYDPKEKWVTIIPISGLVIGLILAGLLVFDGLRSVVKHKYCSVLDEDFSNGLDPKVWLKEVEVGGFGNGQFEMTTNTEENVFIDTDGALTIKPTLQDESLINNNNVIDVLSTGECTSTKWQNCIIGTNTTNGTIVNPVKSGRVSTRKSTSIRYGRVEVTAKLPAGDWLWPAIWMMPVKDTYGAWPRSGEIDLMESRGNNFTYTKQGGNTIVTSALHWGPNTANDGWYRTNAKREALHSSFADRYHTFGVEWSENYLFTYVDNRLMQVLYVNFDRPLYARGRFPLSDSNGTRLVDPWARTGTYSTPFDQDFYLILNLAVGGTNGWFKDGEADKPWVDASPNTKSDFWRARDTWLPTWEKRGVLKVKSVKMWQQEGYNGC